MSGEPVYRPEFELYMKTSSEREERTTIALETMSAENSKTNVLLNTTNELLTSYIHKHDKIEDRVNTNSDDIREMQEIVTDNTKVTSFYNNVKIGLAWLLGGLLTTAGGILAYNFLG